MSDLTFFGWQFERWESVLLQELDYRKSFGNKTDYDFAVLSSHIRILDEKTLVEETVSHLKRIRQDNEQNYQRIVGSYDTFDYFWGALDLDDGVIEVFVDLGAYNGDSAFSYIENFGNYKRIYCYEMTDSSMEKIKQKLHIFLTVLTV